MKLVKNKFLAASAIALGLASFSAVASEEDWAAMQKATIDAKQAVVIANEKVQGHALELEFDEDDGKPYFEVEVYEGKQKHEVKIDAVTGEIVETDVDKKLFETEAPAIGLEQVIEIAEKETGAKVSKVELSRGTYKVEAIQGDAEFKLKIDAEDGSVLESKKDD